MDGALALNAVESREQRTDHAQMEVGFPLLAPARMANMSLAVIAHIKAVGSMQTLVI